MPRGSAPGERRGGRQTGTPNVLPDLRAITLKALMKAGGVDYLVRQSEENPLGFMSLLGRVMPRESHVEVSGELKMRQEVRRDLVDKVIVLMQLPQPTEESEPNIAIEATASPLPAITHNPEAMLRAQASQDREGLSRRAENARRESVGTVNAAVQRAEAMHRERSVRPQGRMPYEQEAAQRIDGMHRMSGNGSDATPQQTADSSSEADSSSGESAGDPDSRAGSTPTGAPIHADAPGGRMVEARQAGTLDSPGES